MIKKTFLIIVAVMMVFSTIVFADKINTGAFKPDTSTTADPELLAVGNKVIGIAQVLGTIIAITALTTLGIKLVLAAPSEKAEIKSKSVPYIVGALMVFSITTLLQIFYVLGSNLI